MYCPDNYDLYCQHEAEQEKWLAKRPKCDICKEPIQDEFLYDMDGVIMCKKCMEIEFMRSAEDYER